MEASNEFTTVERIYCDKRQEEKTNWTRVRICEGCPRTEK